MSIRIAILGLGYVGLPLAIEFSKKYPVTGFDIDSSRIKALQLGEDRTGTYAADALVQSENLVFSSDPDSLSFCTYYIVTVPTPVDIFKKPDLSSLLSCSAMIGRLLKKGDTVIYESTVYPGCTEEDCLPVLERLSGLTLNLDFSIGYSPERINPGDRLNTLTSIRKVVSGSNDEAAACIQELYNRIILAGTYLAPSIKVAEASKVIENAQRDVNISFINELALIFDRMNIDTGDVLEAAGTKWNFLPFRPGLVGGHCIGVDPYYLTHKAESLGYLPQVILSGRRINENMGIFIVSKLVKMMIRKGLLIEGARALILGITFKENCSDIRNSRVIDIYNELHEFGMQVDVYDPNANAGEVMREYGIDMLESIGMRYEAVILAVGHSQFMQLDPDSLKAPVAVLFDIKSFFPRHLVDARL